MSASTLKLYFSFRSPYAWLACFRMSRIIHELDLQLTLVPVSPPKKVAQKIMPSGVKLDYIRQDVTRIAAAYGMQYQRPDPMDCDWLIPHSAFLLANEKGKGLVFANELFRLRFCQGQDVSQHSVIADAAVASGLEADEIIAAVSKREYHRQLLRILATLEEQGVFGVPTFVYGEQRFWGNDRLEWCIREIQRQRGMTVPDLSDDVMAQPWGTSS